jgi:hypothetical protein
MRQPHSRMMSAAEIGATMWARADSTKILSKFKELVAAQINIAANSSNCDLHHTFFTI